MPTSKQELQKITALAYLETDASTTQQLTQDVSAIMAFVEQLRKVDTTGVIPLSHPLDLHQRLREDVVQTGNCVAQLEKIAPLFTDNLYLVPKVIDSGK
jgi:aspartyl-tRNA(Asn)/glutamyl-tRNA(Gln) amidotransferase subunit C